MYICQLAFAQSRQRILKSQLWTKVAFLISCTDRTLHVRPMWESLHYLKVKTLHNTEYSVGEDSGFSSAANNAIFIQETNKKSLQRVHVCDRAHLHMSSRQSAGENNPENDRLQKGEVGVKVGWRNVSSLAEKSGCRLLLTACGDISEMQHLHLREPA